MSAPATYADGYKVGAEDKLTPKAVLLERLAAERTKVAALLAALEEIAKGDGAFNRDPLTHAENTIDNMKSIALAVLAKAGAA